MAKFKERLTGADRATNSRWQVAGTDLGIPYVLENCSIGYLFGDTLQRDGDWVYVFSVKSGRQKGPMMLQRVHWQHMFDKNRYEGWGWNGEDWGWGRPCTPILEGTFGEPSVRKLDDGTWAMCYLDDAKGNIVSRMASGPDRVWSREKIRVAYRPEPNVSGGLYSGFIHPWSRRGRNNLHIMVSKWTRDPNGITTAYHVSQYVGTL